MTNTSEPTIDAENDLREVTTPKGALRYYECGPDSGAVLLFLHGSGPGVTGWRNFRGILPTFAEHFRCLILEFPGFGVSPDFGGHPMVTAQRTVAPFLDALGVHKVHIVGNSMGGGVGINFAIQNPDRIDRLVTIGGIGTNIFSPSPSEGIRLLQEFTEDPTRQRLVDWLKSMVYDQSLVTEELVEERWQLATDAETLAAHAGDAWFASTLPQAVIFPRKAEDVAAVLRFANKRKIPVTARGAGRGYVGGCVPKKGGIVVSFARMNRILDINAKGVWLGMRAVLPGMVARKRGKICNVASTAAHPRHANSLPRPA